MPLYFTETVPGTIRGITVTCFHLFLTAEILISNYVGLLFEVAANWRGMFLSALVPRRNIFIDAIFYVNRQDS